jgi:hypothetical protein
VPVNHLLVARSDVTRERAQELMRLLAALRASGADVTTRAMLTPTLSLAARWCVEQGLTRRVLSPAEIWSGTPHEFI